MVPLIGFLASSTWAATYEVRDDARCVEPDALWSSLVEALGDRVVRRLDTIDVELSSIESSILVSVVVTWQYERWNDTEFVVAAECEHVDELIVRSIERGTEDWAVRPPRRSTDLEPSLAVAPGVSLGPGESLAPRGHLALRYALGTSQASWSADLRISAGAPVPLGVEVPDSEGSGFHPAWAGYAATEVGMGVQIEALPRLDGRLGAHAGPALLWAHDLPVDQAVVVPSVSVCPGVLYALGGRWQVAVDADVDLVRHRLVTAGFVADGSNEVAVLLPRLHVVGGVVFQL